MQRELYFCIAKILRDCLGANFNFYNPSITADCQASAHLPTTESGGTIEKAGME